MNIRSIFYNFNEHLALLRTINDTFYVIILSETWINYNCELCIDYYIGFHCSGTLNKAGNLCMFVHKRFIGYKL